MEIPQDIWRCWWSDVLENQETNGEVGKGHGSTTKILCCQMRLLKFSWAFSSCPETDTAPGEQDNRPLSKTGKRVLGGQEYIVADTDLFIVEELVIQSLSNILWRALKNIKRQADVLETLGALVSRWTRQSSHPLCKVTSLAGRAFEPVNKQPLG